MRIAYLMDQMYLHGGAERILALKINYLIGEGHDVHLVTTQQQGRPAVYPLDGRLHWHDLAVAYDRTKSYFSPKNIMLAVRHFFKLKKLLRRSSPDVVISVSVSPEQYFLPFIFKAIPKIKEFHSSRYDFSAGFLKAKLESALAKYDALVVLNDDERTFYPKHNTHVIPNFTDAAPHPTEKSNTVIAAGRIAPVKQFGRLVEIWALAAGSHQDWKLEIYGNGEARDVEALQALIKKLDLSGSVALMGEVSDLAPALEKASVYAMTSRTECFPMVLLEAQAARLPIVSFDCPTGPRNIVIDQVNGFLVPANDDIFVEKLTQLMDDAMLRERMGAMGGQNLARFSRDYVMRQWNELLKHVTG
jgi:glycosyltransferase involved in cell wall biosynthesis